MSDPLDCHGGPGTTDPACGGCITCLNRIIENDDQERSTLRGRVQDLEGQLLEARDLDVKRLKRLEYWGGLVEAVCIALMPVNRKELLEGFEDYPAGSRYNEELIPELVGKQVKVVQELEAKVQRLTEAGNRMLAVMDHPWRNRRPSTEAWAQAKDAK